MTFRALFFLAPPSDISLILPPHDELVFNENHLGLGLKPGEEDLSGGAPGLARPLPPLSVVCPRHCRHSLAWRRRAFPFALSLGWRPTLCMANTSQISSGSLSRFRAHALRSSTTNLPRHAWTRSSENENKTIGPALAVAESPLTSFLPSCSLTSSHCLCAGLRLISLHQLCL